MSAQASLGVASAAPDDSILSIEHGPEAESSPPQKVRKVAKTSRGGDGRRSRQRKGKAKRARKEKALAEAAQRCHYFVDAHGGCNCAFCRCRSLQ